MAVSRTIDINNRLEFIKRVNAFADLSLPQLTNIAQSLIEEEFEANSIILKEGDIGDNCYFIVNGEVAITTKAGNEDVELAKLKKGDIFGETSILLKTPRNATATTINKTILLVLDGKTFEQIILPKGKPTLAIIKLLQSRSRPEQNPDIEVHPRKNAENSTIYLLKNIHSGDIIEIPEEGYELWNLLDGKTSLEKIIEIFLSKNPDIKPYDAVNLIINLAEDHFVTIKGYDVTIEDRASHHPLWLRALRKIPTIMELFITVDNVDGWLTKTYPYVKWYFNGIVQLLMISFLIVGWLLFLVGSAHVVSNLHSINPSYLWWIYPCFFLSLFIHEFTHAYLTKHYGYKVRAMGFGWFWLGPAAFCDTTDSLLAPKSQRLAINLIGVYTEAGLAGLVCIISYIFHDHPISVLGWLYALIVYTNIIRNLDPIIDLDGYYTLQDLTGESQLREKAVSLLTHGLRQAWRENAFWTTYRAETIFWCYIIVFHLIILPLIVWIEITILSSFFTFFQNFYVILGLPLLIVVLSILSVWADLYSYERVAQD